MKKIIFFLVFILVVEVNAASLGQDNQDKDINLGRIYFPKAFVHASKDYNKGVYLVTLTKKEGYPWFKVFNKKKDLLFDEMAVVTPYKGKRRNFKYRVRKGLLKESEYFRIRVIKPDKMIMAFFLVKQTEASSSKTEGVVN